MVLIGGVPGAARSQDTPPPVVAELFTSQSCSSCPAADALAADLLADYTGDEPLYIVGCHVTYWDHLNWKDTLSLPACTARQHAYAAAFGNKRVYTPQIVINGRHEVIGNKRSAVIAALEKARGDGVKPLPLTLENGALHADLRGVPADVTYNLLAFDNAYAQSVKAGENRGKTMRYVHPVRAFLSVTPEGDKATIPLTPDARHDGYLLLAHSNKNGAILAAGQVMAAAP